MKSLRRLGAEIRRDPDLRAFLAELPLRPRLWRRLWSNPVSEKRPRYLSNAAQEPIFALSVPGPLLSWREGPAPRRPSRLDLASRLLKIPEVGPLPWDAEFDDVEDTAALHRFAWLLPEVLGWARAGNSRLEGAKSFRELASDWALAHRAPERTAPWQSYTVSERLVNWTLAALAFGEPLREDPDLWRSIRVQVEHLRGNLEYHGEGLTGNHLSDNGRALYLCGLACGERAWAADGRTILLNELERIFPEPQFLREGSSHYQFLVARNYCEALWAARAAGDHAAEKVLGPAVARMAEGCRFFLVETPTGSWKMPLIGDISPDCPPDWLLGVPWVAASLGGVAPPPGKPPPRGWHELFASSLSTAPIATPRPAHSSSWSRVAASDWVLMAHVNRDGFLFYPGHAHQDTGAFVAFHRGSEVIVDAGRGRYLDDEAGRWGLSCWAHSLLSVDRLNPGPFWRRIYTKDFLARSVGAHPSLESSGGRMTIAHGGFSRSRGVGACSRSLAVLDDGSLEICDAVEGLGRHRVDIVFHFAGRAFLKDGAVTVDGDGWRCRLILPAGLTEIAVTNAPAGSEGFGWRADRYGGKVPASAVVAGTELLLPWRGRSVLRMER